MEILYPKKSGYKIYLMDIKYFLHPIVIKPICMYVVISLGSIFGMVGLLPILCDIKSVWLAD